MKETRGRFRHTTTGTSRCCYPSSAEGRRESEPFVAVPPALQQLQQQQQRHSPVLHNPASGHSVAAPLPADLPSHGAATVVHQSPALDASSYVSGGTFAGQGHPQQLQQQQQQQQEQSFGNVPHRRAILDRDPRHAQALVPAHTAGMRL
ncbi:hypothetical protein DIPPA_00692 [Diplonema papillatum]|nr:hypothetical protein DIPPA_00692 [Diplonema papillatum]